MIFAALLGEVREFCAACRGRVSVLAAHLGVLQHQATTCLNEKTELGSESTPQIRAWLEIETSAILLAGFQEVGSTDGPEKVVFL